MKALVAGWFSFEQCNATAGDLLARDVLLRWLRTAGIGCDYATAPPFTGGVDWRGVDPAGYTHVIFVCGPFPNEWPGTEFIERFRAARLIGLNLSMIEDLARWNPFDVLLERDSPRQTRPDIVFLSDPPRAPVLGLVLVHPQKEYGARARHRQADAALKGLLRRREAAVVPVDTGIEHNAGGLAGPAEIESLIARTDAVATTRLHGMVLAVKNGVPPLVMDPVAGGAKVSRQARAIGWPCVFTADAFEEAALERALDWCLGAEGRREADRCRQRAVATARPIREELLGALREAPGGRSEREATDG